MGSSADDRLTERSYRKRLGKNFSETDITPILRRAEQLSLTDNLKLNEAIGIVTGQTHHPFGTPNP